MKQTLICVLMYTLFLVGCAKSLADDPGFYNPNFHLRSTGSSAQELLTDTVFTSLKIEVQYMRDARPSEETLSSLKKFLTKHLHKPAGIHISVSEIPSPADTVFTLQSVMQTEDSYRKEFTTQNEIVVYVLFADGYYYNQKLLGYAYRNTSVVLFDRHIKENASRYKKHSLTYLQSRVLQHEFGHLLGLVNSETATGDDHHDTENGKHCTNKNCLMYYLVDTEDYPLVLLKREPPALDKNCIQALRKNGGK